MFETKCEHIVSGNKIEYNLYYLMLLIIPAQISHPTFWCFKYFSTEISQ